MLCVQINGMDKAIILDMTSSELRQFLYLAAAGGVVLYRMHHEVLEPDFTPWETTGCIPVGLSVIESRKGNVLVTCGGDLNAVREYQPNGKLIREVSLSSDIQRPFHAIELAFNRSV
jgi:hypothetical protein